MTRYPNRVRGHWLLLGTTQSGKTTWLVYHVLPEVRNFVIIDPEAHYTSLEGAQLAMGVRELIQLLRTRLEQPNRRRYRIVLLEESPSEQLKAVEAVWSFHEHMHTKVGKTLLVHDEAGDMFAFLGGGSSLPATYGRVFRKGAKRGLMSLLVGQNPQQIPSKARHLSGHHVIFRLTGRLPQRMDRNLGDEADQVTELEDLTPGSRPERGRHYLTWPRRIEDPAAEVIGQLD